MTDWLGFTDADIEKIQNNPTGRQNLNKPKIVKPVSSQKAAKSNNSNRRPKPNARRDDIAQQTRSTTHIPPGAALSKPNKELKQKVEEAAQKHPETTNQNAKNPESSVMNKNIVIDEESVREKEKIKLEDVHLRQKQMEEKNRKKKAMLTKEIAERKKKAFAESHKLVKIQNELAKLDQMLNIDVSILRDKIEEACIEYASAQKRFNKAEAEYVEAKMDLNTKTVKKEDLTEHLYHMIQANEERKAKKLEELMMKLDVEEEVLEANEQERLMKEAKEQERKTKEANEKEKIDKEVLGVKEKEQTTEVSPQETDDRNCLQAAANVETIRNPNETGDTLHGASST